MIHDASLGASVDGNLASDGLGVARLSERNSRSLPRQLSAKQSNEKFDSLRIPFQFTLLRSQHREYAPGQYVPRQRRETAPSRPRREALMKGFGKALQTAVPLENGSCLAVRRAVPKRYINPACSGPTLISSAGIHSTLPSRQTAKGRPFLPRAPTPSLCAALTAASISVPFANNSEILRDLSFAMRIVLH